MYFRNYGLRKTWLDKCQKSSASEYTSTRKMANVHKHSPNLNGWTFNIFTDPCKSNWVGTKPLLMICKILILFVNTFTAIHKYSLLNTDNLTQPIQMQLSQKQKTFSPCFSAFLKSRWNFQNCSKKDDPHSWCIYEIIHCKKPC